MTRGVSCSWVNTPSLDTTSESCGVAKSSSKLLMYPPRPPRGIYPRWQVTRPLRTLGWGSPFRQPCLSELHTKFRWVAGCTKMLISYGLQDPPPPVSKTTQGLPSNKHIRALEPTCLPPTQPVASVPKTKSVWMRQYEKGPSRLWRRASASRRVSGAPEGRQLT